MNKNKMGVFAFIFLALAYSVLAQDAFSGAMDTVWNFFQNEYAVALTTILLMFVVFYAVFSSALRFVKIFNIDRRLTKQGKAFALALAALVTIALFSSNFVFGGTPYETAKNLLRVMGLFGTFMLALAMFLLVFFGMGAGDKKDAWAKGLAAGGLIFIFVGMVTAKPGFLAWGWVMALIAGLFMFFGLFGGGEADRPPTPETPTRDEDRRRRDDRRRRERREWPEDRDQPTPVSAPAPTDGPKKELRRAMREIDRIRRSLVNTRVEYANLDKNITVYAKLDDKAGSIFWHHRNGDRETHCKMGWEYFKQLENLDQHEIIEDIIERIKKIVVELREYNLPDSLSGSLNSVVEQANHIIKHVGERKELVELLKEFFKEISLAYNNTGDNYIEDIIRIMDGSLGVPGMIAKFEKVNTDLRLSITVEKHDHTGIRVGGVPKNFHEITVATVNAFVEKIGNGAELSGSHLDVQVEQLEELDKRLEAFQTAAQAQI